MWAVSVRNMWQRCSNGPTTAGIVCLRIHCGKGRCGRQGYQGTRRRGGAVWHAFARQCRSPWAQAAAAVWQGAHGVLHGSGHANKRRPSTAANQQAPQPIIALAVAVVARGLPLWGSITSMQQVRWLKAASSYHHMSSLPGTPSPNNSTRTIAAQPLPPSAPPGAYRHVLDELLYELVEREQHVAVGAQQRAAAVLKRAAVHVAVQHAPQHAHELTVQPCGLLSTSNSLLRGGVCVGGGFGQTKVCR